MGVTGRTSLVALKKPPGGVSQVWQAKDLLEVVFGCVANKGVTGEILEVWQGKELARFWWKAGSGLWGIKRTSRRPFIIVSRTERYPTQKSQPLYHKVINLSINN